MPDKYTARIVRFDGQRDLALLTVDGEAFWEGVTPLELRDELPAMGDRVKVDRDVPSPSPSLSMRVFVLSLGLLPGGVEMVSSLF